MAAEASRLDRQGDLVAARAERTYTEAHRLAALARQRHREALQLVVEVGGLTADLDWARRWFSCGRTTGSAGSERRWTTPGVIDTTVVDEAGPPERPMLPEGKP